MFLFIGVLALRQTRCRTVMWEFCCGFIIPDFICTIHRIVTQQIFHLSLCPFTVLSGLAIVVILVVYQCHHLCRCIISCRTPGVQPEVASRCDRSDAAGHILIQCFFHRAPAVHLFIRTLSGCLFIFVNEVRVLFAGDLAQNTLYPAPDIVPAVYIAGCCIIVIVRENLFQIVMVSPVTPPQS